MKVSAKQDAIAQAIADGFKEILLEGAVGTSKTYGAALLLLGIALDYPGSHIFVGRRHLTKLRKTTILSFREAAEDMGLVENKHYNENLSSPYFRVFTEPGQPDSYIYFIELDHIKDPQFLNIKGLNATCVYIDEADEVVELAFTTLASRAGRHNKNGAPDFALLSCNANDTWVKRRFYNKFKKPLEYGRLAPNQCVIEFELADSFLPGSYYAKFSNNPVQWKERYLNNNWEYGDDEDSLFKYRYLDKLHIDNVEQGFKTIGYDVAREENGDRSVLALWEGMALIDVVIIKDFDEKMSGGDQARKLYDYALLHQVGYENIGCDGIGNGVTVIDNLETLFGWRIKSFIAGAMPEAKRKQKERKKQFTRMEEQPITYNNLRTEQAHLFSQDTESGKVHFYDGCNYLTDFKKEATMHNYDTKDSQLVLEPKDKVKQRTGHSPDIFDAVLIGYWLQRNSSPPASYGKRPDPKGATTQNRLSVKGRKPITSGLYKKQF